MKEAGGLVLLVFAAAWLLSVSKDEWENGNYGSSALLGLVSLTYVLGAWILVETIFSGATA